jgi:xanthine/uracil permease
MNTSATDTLSRTTYKLTPMTAVLGVQMLFVAFVALVLVTGVGGLSVGSADWALKGIGLAGILGVVANLILPGRVRYQGQS